MATMRKIVGVTTGLYKEIEINSGIRAWGPTSSSKAEETEMNAR